MARAKKKKAVSLKKSWQENYASFILGAIIVVVLGLLVANFISNRSKNIDTGISTQSQTEEQQSQNNQKQSEYTVQKDDSLSKIAEKYYGDRMMWPVLVQANDIKNPNLIYADMTLKVPSKDEATKIAAQLSQTAYTVQKGDTLFAIAEKMYGDGSKWTLIDKANNVGRLPNGNPLIFAGNTLKIPR